ncbi:MAG: 50S ribosomal protein L18 [Candidatus Eisenbacteria bacterium]
MRKRTLQRAVKRQKRHLRIRKKISGTLERPRLAVCRSLRHISAQLVDDASGRTLASASSLSKEIRDSIKDKRKTDVSKAVGVLLAQKAKAAGIERAKFDRGGCLYHGRVKALAEGAREGGLQF